jgi:NADPH-dependent 2,4-dienoyl-CoA reductase/sulfur reductase-like enzyme
MFAVPRYSQRLEDLRQARNVEGLFQHNLVKVDPKTKTATFKNLAADGKEVEKEFDFLHVVPPQKPFDFVAKSPLGKLSYGMAYYGICGPNSRLRS